jgi:hypothetical protein
MKSNTTATLQFSGYPLEIVQYKGAVTNTRTSLRLADLSPVQLRSFTFNSLQKVHAMVQAPENWDENWFSSYE